MAYVEEILGKRVKAVDLLGWKVNNVNHFYDRDHPVLHPESMAYIDYWRPHMYRSVEGWWVNDNDQWIWMYPKLYFYINIGKIVDTDQRTKSRIPISPLLRDTEWIMFTYLYCAMGFSGFEEDEEYTCHRTVKRIQEDPDSVLPFELEALEPSVYKSDGVTLKTYQEAWDYLRTPKQGSLGKPLYDNEARNSFILAARGLGKSFAWGVGDCLHEMITGSVKYWEDAHRMATNKIEIFAGSSQEDKIQEFMDKIRFAYINLPGTYGTGDDEYPSPFHKEFSGSWKVRSKAPLTHSYKTKSGKSKGSQSKLLSGVFTTENPEAGVGIRPVRIFVEEVGLLGNALQVHGANRNSLRINGQQFGVGSYIGTSGNMKKVKEPRRIMLNPDNFEVYGIPNYWEGGSNIGMFIPSLYAHSKFKDANGNTDIEQALKFYKRERERLMANGSSKMLESSIMYEPLVPSEMFSVAGTNNYPQVELMEQERWIEINEVENRLLSWGDLVWDPNELAGVRFVHDVNGNKTPLFSFDSNEQNLESAFVINEQPVENPPDDLYEIFYDPVRDDNKTKLTKGVSLASIYVYKGSHYVDGSEDSVVAWYCGRYAQVNKIHELCVKAALFYGAKITFEKNLPGFKNYCRDNGYLHLLVPTPFNRLSKSVYGAAAFDYGIQMNKDLSQEAEYLLIDWLLKERRREETDYGTKIFRNLNFFNDRGGIQEMLNYSEDGNFDRISALKLMAIRIAAKKPKRQSKDTDKRKEESIYNYMKNNLYKRVS